MVLMLLLIGAVLFFNTDFEKGQALANGQACTNLADMKVIEEGGVEEAERRFLLNPNPKTNSKPDTKCEGGSSIDR